MAHRQDNHMITKKVSAIISRVDRFPPLPAVAERVLEITADPESSSRELMEVVNADQSLTVMVLKMANSPFFGLSRNVDSLDHALTLLGFTEIRNMVLGRAIFGSFKNVGRNGMLEMRQFWRHSFVCGLAARIIGAELEWHAHDFFLAGLIHDIGKLVLVMTFPDGFSKAVYAAGPVKQESFEAEKDIFGVGHDEVGMMLLKRWMFPKSLIVAVGYHHRPRETNGESRFARVIHAADILSHLDELPEDMRTACLRDGEPLNTDVPSLFQAHGFAWNISTMEKLLRELAQQKQRASEMLAIFLG